MSSIAMSPDQVREKAAIGEHIPAYVLMSVNRLLAAKYVSRSAPIRVDVEEIIDAILENSPGTTRHDIFDNRWLDFEPVFRAVGWKVAYDRPAYNESGVAHFMFTPVVKR